MRIDVEKIAALSMLNVGREELESLQNELEKMVGFAEQLKALDCGEETAVCPAQGKPLREDVLSPCLTNDTLLQNAPQEKSGCFFVPRALEAEEKVCVTSRS